MTYLILCTAVANLVTSALAEENVAIPEEKQIKSSAQNHELDSNDNFSSDASIYVMTRARPLVRALIMARQLRCWNWRLVARSFFTSRM